MKKRKFGMGSRGESLLYSTIIFIVLNLVFFAIMLFFITREASQAGLLEQVYAKEIALLIDKAKPGMEIILDFEDAARIAEKNKVKPSVSVEGNLVSVSLSKKVSNNKGYSYSFFNDVKVDLQYISKGKSVKIVISEKKEKEKGGVK